MSRGLSTLAVVAAALALPASAQSPIVALGKQRAAASTVAWETREAAHPLLGPIVFAFMKTPVPTKVGTHTLASNVYLSCERSTAKIAIELANGTSVDDPGGLKPKRMPRLTCNTLGVDDNKPASEPLEASWIVNDLGDAMARGLWPSKLRDCVSIGVSEELVLPAGWEQPSATVQFEIPTYAREVDAVFARCGEPTAWPYDALAAKTTPAAKPAPARRDAAASTPQDWISARVVAEGRTNVRAKANVRSALVIRLDPGDIVLVQRGEGDWWKARSRPTARVPFEGYIRRDRLVLP